MGLVVMDSRSERNAGEDLVSEDATPLFAECGE